MFAAHEKADMIPKTRKKLRSEIKERRCLILVGLLSINYLPFEIRKTSFCILASRGMFVIKRNGAICFMLLSIAMNLWHETSMK